MTWAGESLTLGAGEALASWLVDAIPGGGGLRVRGWGGSEGGGGGGGGGLRVGGWGGSEGGWGGGMGGFVWFFPDFGENAGTPSPRGGGGPLFWVGWVGGWVAELGRPPMSFMGRGTL